MQNRTGRFHSDSGTQEPENGVVVDGVSDTEHNFASQVRTPALSSVSP